MVRRPCLAVAMMLLMACLLPGGCLRWPGPTSAPPVLALYGGPEGYELVHIPALARVERFRLAEGAGEAAAGARRIGGVPVAAGPSTLDEAALKQLSALLRDAGSYDFAAAAPAAGGARPTVALRFAGVKKTLDLLFSFGDSTLQVYEGERRVGGASIAPRAKELEALLAPAGR